MKKFKQRIALAGVILLVVMCVTSLVAALIAPGSTFFKASIGCCIAVPVVLYAILMVAKTMKQKKSPIIDAIIFDVGNVLIDFDWKGCMKNLGFDDETIAYLAKNLIHDPLWNEFDRGTRPYNSILDEFCRRHPAYENQIRTFIKAMPDTIVNRPYVDFWLSDLKEKGYELYIISNWCEPVYEAVKNTKLSFTKYMDGCVWSYQAKCIKPEAKIYQKLLRTYKLDPARCVFLDDRQENLDGASALGFHTILAEDHDYAVQRLKDLGVK